MSPQDPSTEPLDIASMDAEALQALQKRISARIAQEKAKSLESLRGEYVALIKRIDEACAPYGLTARKFLASTQQQVMAAVEAAAGQETVEKPRRKRATVAPKYRNPENHAQSWSGRGHQPNWVTEWVQNGGKMQDLLIQE